MEVQDMYEDLPDPGPVNANQDNEYVVCSRKLEAYFQAEENVTYERLSSTYADKERDRWFVYVNKLVIVILVRLYD